MEEDAISAVEDLELGRRDFSVVDIGCRMLIRRILGSSLAYLNAALMKASIGRVTMLGLVTKLFFLHLELINAIITRQSIYAFVDDVMMGMSSIVWAINTDAGRFGVV